MKKLLTSDKVYIRKSGILNAGRGVYARRDIKKNEIIEKCPVIEVPKHDLANLRESILVTYFYYFGKNKQQLLIALGFGSIYNHAYKANATYKISHIEKTIDFIALKDINKDDEITVNYRYPNPKNKNPLWFEIVPLPK
jgi:SET domain-containing protein